MPSPFLCNAPNDNSSLTQEIFPVVRRNINSGWINIGQPSPELIPNDIADRWVNNRPIFLPKFFTSSLSSYAANIETSKKLYAAILAGQEIDGLLDEPVYLTRLGEMFELLSTRFDESDRQELVSVDFDLMKNGELAMEDLWMRISWLSFIEADESLRFRFSFGMEGFDDVSLDIERQLAAAELCERIFPESGIISHSEPLMQLLKKTLSVNDLYFLERIVYYNARNGGAQFHHDAEKGHLGVVYAQLTGQTLWLALSKQELMDEIQRFLSKNHHLDGLRSVVKESAGYERLIKTTRDRVLLEQLLDDPSNDEIAELLNELPAFFAELVNGQYAYVLSPGDVILLPQQSQQNCAWHSVFCLGEEAGQALSFAIKSSPDNSPRFPLGMNHPG